MPVSKLAGVETVQPNDLYSSMQVKVFLVSTRRLTNSTALETSIVMEFCDQETLLSRHQVIWELLEVDRANGLRWILRCLCEIVGGMIYMHNLDLTHGDLKCNNVLLQSTRSEARGFTCKISDMGCSRLTTATRQELLTGSHGSPWYAAPEVLRDGSLFKVSNLPM